MLGTLPQERKADGKIVLATLVLAYNYIHYSVLGLSSYCFMFGCHLRLPIDVQFGISVPNLSAPSRSKHVQKM